MSTVLLLSCPDRQGVVAATAQAIAAHGANIVHAEQYVKGESGDDGAVFFQRLVFDLVREGTDHQTFLESFAPIATDFQMTVDRRDLSTPTPTAIMCSKQPHCLYDLLTRWRSGELPMDLRVVISNHPDHR
ncbi:MAG: ACT domain-containing protein, partial [Ilumatobacter sp.]